MNLKILDSRLYKIYYPVKTEADKESLVLEYKSRILRTLHARVLLNQSALINIEKEYDKRLKPQDVLHNKRILIKKSFDFRFRDLNREFAELLGLEERFIHGAETIEDVNHVLRIINEEHYETIRMLIVGMACISVLICIFGI